MRLATKQIASRQECFEASEHGFSVRISANGSTVLIRAETDKHLFITDMSLPEFARTLAQAIENKKICQL